MKKNIALSVLLSLSSLLILFNFNSSYGEEVVKSSLYVNSKKFDETFLDQEQKEQVQELIDLLCSDGSPPHAFSNSLTNSNYDENTQQKSFLLSKSLADIKSSPSSSFTHRISHIDQDTSQITLEDESIWQIGWLYRNDFNNWLVGDRLKIYKGSGFNNIKIENLDRQSCVWAVLNKNPSAAHLDYLVRLTSTTLISGKGWILQGNVESVQSWKSRESLFIFHDEEGFYKVWNLNRNQDLGYLRFIANGKIGLAPELDQHVVGQKEATQAVAKIILNNLTGLRNKNVPIGSFLFLGPTGVGKTELAKQLSVLLYGDQNAVIRFDMGHFSEESTVAKLLGSPPGYKDSQDGGQLINALEVKPRSIVLLDELEKAHPKVIKVFLSILEEGYVLDYKGKKIHCNDAVFVMTSNLCSLEIANLYHEGYSHNEILSMIEPHVIGALSPEFYNRIQPIVFRPLTPEIICQLVELFLEEVSTRVKSLNGMTLVIDQAAKDYLAEHGYHPSLGARPLKRLIENSIVGNLSNAIVSAGIPDDSTVGISYSADDNQWHIFWE